MRFMKAEVPELSPEELQILVRKISDFVAACGVVTLTEWEGLSDVERAILVEIRRGGLGREQEVIEALANDLERRKFEVPAQGASKP